jgi:hypothetical protein
VEPADGEPDISDGPRVEAAAAERLACGEDAIAGRRVDVQVEVRRRRCSGLAEDLDGRIGEPAAPLVPREQRQKRSETKPVAEPRDAVTVARRHH